MKNYKNKIYFTGGVLMFIAILTGAYLNLTSSVSYNQVMQSKAEISHEPDDYKSGYDGKVVKWRGKISSYYSQATDVKFCVVDKDHKSVDASNPCDWFLAVSGEINEPSDCEESASWYCHRMDYIMKYYNVPIGVDEDYTNTIYTLTGKISGIDCGVDDKCVPYIVIINISKQ